MEHHHLECDHELDLWRGLEIEISGEDRPEDADQDMERFWSLVAREECQSCTRRKPWTEARLLTALGPWNENFNDYNIVKSENFLYLISWGAG